jgi:IS5 family transposase
MSPLSAPIAAALINEIAADRQDRAARHRRTATPRRGVLRALRGRAAARRHAPPPATAPRTVTVRTGRA